MSTNQILFEKMDKQLTAHEIYKRDEDMRDQQGDLDDEIYQLNILLERGELGELDKRNLFAGRDQNKRSTIQGNAYNQTARCRYPAG
jgi:hypothetical protein